MSDPLPDRRPTPSWTERYAKGKDEQTLRREFWDDFDSGWTMVAELVGATLTWGGIGWLLDQWLGLAPILMSLGFIVGFSAGFYLVWARSTGRITRQRQTTGTGAVADLSRPTESNPADVQP